MRLVKRDPLPIAGVPLNGLVRASGLSFPDPRLVAAIALDRLVAARVPLSDGVLFHELVHVAQFRLLGVREFSRLYVRGFLASGSYEGIPLERCAYELEARFELGESEFSVEEELKAWRDGGRF